MVVVVGVVAIVVLILVYILVIVVVTVVVHVCSYPSSSLLLDAKKAFHWKFTFKNKYETLKSTLKISEKETYTIIVKKTCS